MATAFGESQCPHGPRVLSGGGGRRPAPPGNAVEIGPVRGKWPRRFRGPGRDCPPNAGVCVVGQGSRRWRWWMRAPRVGLCRMIRSWPSSPGSGEGYPGQNEGQHVDRKWAWPPRTAPFARILTSTLIYSGGPKETLGSTSSPLRRPRGCWPRLPARAWALGTPRSPFRLLPTVRP